MSTIRLLDCTLRDGGYINDWQFGENNIHAILHGLNAAKIDIIECGYLTQKRAFDKNSTQITDVEYANSMLADYRGSSEFVAMINFGEYSIEDIPERKAGGLDGIRVAFHKKDRFDAIEYCRRLKEKGYAVYLQPMVALGYTDEEFIDLIRRANEIEPAVYYIVDSFGAMKKQDLLHALYLTDHNLKKGIKIGFHSHNNLQLSYSHAQLLFEQSIMREIIVDSSIYGMGRGAGNLNTELFAEYLNEFQSAHYSVEALLRLSDNVIEPIYQKKAWGYALPFYLSAVHNCHPNYASYLADKNTLTVESMNQIFTSIDAEHRFSFDRDYIRSLYLKYQSENRPQMDTAELERRIRGREVLLIAPGRSSMTEAEKIKAEMDGKVVIALNHVPRHLSVDYVFVSNLRRWDNLDKKSIPQAILTSNIRFDTSGAFVVDYASLLNDTHAVKDNAGLMLIALLIKWKASKIYIAGMDGYSTDHRRNFAEASMEVSRKDEMLQAVNDGMAIMLRQYGQLIPITFVTKPEYIRI